MDRAEFLTAMRGVAHSVSVVTTNGKAGQHGATVSAFSSVSADPPTTMVCLNLSSQICKSVLENRRFNINVLQEGDSFLSQRFAGFHDKEINDRFDGVDLMETDIPSIQGATVFECEVDQTVTSGTHEVVLGRVLSVIQGGKAPLTYLDGGYFKVVPIKDA